jgi:hypothetical protein
VGGLISKRERKSSAPPRFPAKLQPGPVAIRSYWRVWLLLGLLSAGGAVAAAFWFQEGTWPPRMLNRLQTVVPGHENDRHALQADKLEQKEEHRTPHLVFQNSSAAVNQPLPLGIVLNNGTGNETLVLSGFVEGTSLSAGTALSTTRWSVPGRDLDKTFISAPQDFNDTMQVTATLYSSTQDILETKEVRFQWNSSRKGDKLPVTISPAPRLAR